MFKSCTAALRNYYWWCSRKKYTESVLCKARALTPVLSDPRHLNLGKDPFQTSHFHNCSKINAMFDKGNTSSVSPWSQQTPRKIYQAWTVGKHETLSKERLWLLTVFLLLMCDMRWFPPWICRWAKLAFTFFHDHSDPEQGCALWREL